MTLSFYPLTHQQGGSSTSKDKVSEKRKCSRRALELKLHSSLPADLSERVGWAVCQLTQLFCNSRRLGKRSAALNMLSLEGGFGWIWDCKTLHARQVTTQAPSALVLRIRVIGSWRPSLVEPEEKTGLKDRYLQYTYHEGRTQQSVPLPAHARRIPFIADERTELQRETQTKLRGDNEHHTRVSLSRLSSSTSLLC